MKIPEKDGFYQYEPSKSKYPAYHFRMSARDLALYGQLYLQKGQWQGKQLVPQAWIEAATSLQTSNGSNPESDWDQGYGYQPAGFVDHRRW